MDSGHPDLGEFLGAFSLEESMPTVPSIKVHSSVDDVEQVLARSSNTRIRVRVIRIWLDATAKLSGFAATILGSRRRS